MTNEAPPIDYRALLEEEQASLEHQLGELGFGEAGDTGLDYDANFADSSQVTAERGETEALVNELRSSLKEIQAAIVRLDAGTYGTCARCGKPIAEARLEAMPATTLCITCASAQR